jgi:ornithine cyclodeaminase/alanine dehydrogenase-like protein (mu-crystallin family)
MRPRGWPPLHRAYKAMGIAIENLVAANLAYQRAKLEQGGGAMVW